MDYTRSLPLWPGYDEFKVSKHHKKPLLDFILRDLKQSGCRILFASPPDRAPFRITFETSYGEALGIVVYAFYANTKTTKNRPSDEYRFQPKYGEKPRGKPVFIDLWHDPLNLYTTLFCGISPEEGFFVGTDPVLKSPAHLFISTEFKRHHVETILSNGWHAWQRDNRAGRETTELDFLGVETMVGGARGSFLRYVRFEREASGEDPGPRLLLAERYRDRKLTDLILPPGLEHGLTPAEADERHMHELAQEFDMSPEEVLDLIAEARRLKMAVRGWVAEKHLYRRLKAVPGVGSCTMIDTEGGADVALRYQGSPMLTVECKNVLRQTYADGTPKVDFQRTRAAKGDPCSRYYSPQDFDIVAACLHAVEEQWDFRYVLPPHLERHRICEGKLDNNVRVDGRWVADASHVLREAARARSG